MTFEYVVIMVCRKLVILIFVHFAFTACPDPFRVFSKQDVTAERPRDLIILSCVFRGIPATKLEFFWWLIDDTNIPLYTFWKDQNIEEIDPRHSSLVVNATQSFFTDDFETQLWLNISLISPSTYRCEMTTKDHKTCSHTQTVRFQEPTLNLWLDRDLAYYGDNNMEAIVVNVTCEVDAADGIPDMSLSYIGNKGTDVKRINNEFHVKDYGNHVYGVIREEMRLPTSGHVLCRTTDTRGIYKEDSPILTHMSGCPEGISISVNQLGPARRPQDEVVLECVLDGAPRRNLTYYWWIDVMDNTPIYIFSEVYAIDEITEAYKGSKIMEQHIFNEFKIVTVLTLLVNMTSHLNYRCELYGEDIGFCSDSVLIQFEEPQILIVFDEEPQKVGYHERGSLTDVVCSVHMSSGKPTFNIEYRGNRTHQVQKIQNTTLSGRNNTYSFEAIMRLPHNGTIICIVSDLLGDYTVNRKIIGRENVSASTVKKANRQLYLLSCLLLGLLFVPCFVWKIRRLRKNAWRSSYQKVDRKDLEVPIKELSKDPKLFAEGGPTQNDILQTRRAQAESWLLAALDSLCIDAGREYIEKLFFPESDLRSSSIKMNLWFYGERKTVDVETSLPTKNRRLDYLHSSVENVFWSALVRKMYIRKENDPFYEELKSEWDAHVLEDLTGCLAVTRESDKFSQLKEFYEKGFPMTCRRKIESSLNGFVFCTSTEIAQNPGSNSQRKTIYLLLFVYAYRMVFWTNSSLSHGIFYSITKIEQGRSTLLTSVLAQKRTVEAKQKKINFLYSRQKINNKRIKIREFPDIKSGTKKRTSKFPIKTAMTRPMYPMHTFWISHEEFQKLFQQYRVLLLDLERVATREGRWEQTHIGGNDNKSAFWLNPQYSITCDARMSSALCNVKVYVALMQKPPEQKKYVSPLRIGYAKYQVVERAHQESAFWQKDDLELMDIEGPHSAREVSSCLTLSVYEKYVIIPFAAGGSGPNDFVLRLLATKENAACVESVE